MSEFDVIQLLVAILALVLLSGGAGIALLWQRQQTQAAEFDRRLGELRDVPPAQVVQREVAFETSLEEALASPVPEAAIEPIPEARTAQSAGEERLLAFIRQRTGEPLRELA